MKGIKCNSNEVNAILSGDKSQIRLVIKGAELEISHPAVHSWAQSPRDGRFYAKAKNDEVKQQYVTTFPFNGIKCPHQIGDFVFVKEDFLVHRRYAKYKYYDGDVVPDNHREYLIKVSATSMPREASRITLRIKDISVERLQDISEEDAIAEGIKNTGGWNGSDYDDGEFYLGKLIESEDGMNWKNEMFEYAGEAFEELWNSTHKKPEEKWEVNPFIFKIEFEVVK